MVETVYAFSLFLQAARSYLAAEEDDNAGEDYLHAVNHRAVKWFGCFTRGTTLVMRRFVLSGPIFLPSEIVETHRR
jgi:hypothetical protein